MLGAQTEGMIGYLIEQELGNVLPYEQHIATVLTMIEVDPNDPALHKPSKPIGPIYTREQADRLAKERGWTMAPDNDKFRRVVPSPRPQHIFEIEVIDMLVKNGVIVICAGGGGIPTIYRPGRILEGVEAVIDKDRAGALLAQELGADACVMKPHDAAEYNRIVQELQTQSSTLAEGGRQILLAAGPDTTPVRASAMFDAPV